MISFFNPRNIWLIAMTAAIALAMYLRPPLSAADVDRLKEQHLRTGLRVLAYEAALSGMLPEPSRSAMKEGVRDNLRTYEKWTNDREILPIDQFVLLTYIGDKPQFPSTGRASLLADLKLLYVDGKPLEESALFDIGSGELAQLHQKELMRASDADAFKEDLLKRSVIVLGFQLALALGGLALFGAGTVILYVFFKKPPHVRYFVTLQTVSDEERRVFLETAVLYATLVFPVGMAFAPFTKGWLEPMQFALIHLLGAFGVCLYYFHANTRPGLLTELTIPAESRTWKEVLAGIAGFAVIFPPAVLTLLFFSGLASQDSVRFAHPVAFEIEKNPVLVFILAAIAAPILEEVIFRCFLYGHFRKDQRIRFAAFFSGSIFAVLHPQGIIALPYLTVLGMGLAILREYRPGVIAPVVTHAMVNGFAVILALFFRHYL